MLKEIKKPMSVFAVSTDDDDDDINNDINEFGRSSSPQVAAQRPKRANRDFKSYKVINFYQNLK